jgi:hypothetical protein
MFRKAISALVILVSLLVVSLSMAEGENTPVEITLLSPADQAIIADLSVTFSWMPVEGATQYRLRVRGDKLKYKVEVPITACDIAAQTCAFSSAGDPNWKPMLGDTLKWAVAAKLEEGKAFSPARLLHTDFLADPGLISPVNGAVITSTMVSMSWTGDIRASQFSLVFKPNKEGKTAPIKFTPDAACDTATMQCTATVDLTSFDGKARPGAYEWWVMASRDDLKGKAKSEKRMFTADLLPDLVALEPGDGMTIDYSTPLFYWEDSGVIDQYRIVARNQDGQQVNTPWYAVDDICEDDECELDTLVLSNGVWKWHLEGRISNIDGRAKSPSMTLIVYLPEATAEAMPLP